MAGRGFIQMLPARIAGLCSQSQLLIIRAGHVCDAENSRLASARRPLVCEQMSEQTLYDQKCPTCGTCRFWRGHAYMLNGYCVRPFDGGASVLTRDWEGCPNHALREEATVES